MKKDLTIKEYQDKAATTAIYPSLGDMAAAHVGSQLGRQDLRNNMAGNLYYPALGLAGEVGELCNKIKKIMRDDNGVISEEKREALSGELGDIMWYVAAVAKELELDLATVCQGNSDKLASRKERNTLSGSGDNR